MSTRRQSLFAAMMLALITARQGSSQLPAAKAHPEVKWTSPEKRDTYEVYSFLLRAEIPNWNVAAWAISRETKQYPSGGNHSLCLRPSPLQQLPYQPLINDYIRKNKMPLILERKLDLPEYALVGTDEIRAVAQRWIERPGSSTADTCAGERFPANARIYFEVSAVGFNQDRTRALVYVAHFCGGLCGSGGYHFLVKENGEWQIDTGYRGASCGWVS